MSQIDGKLFRTVDELDMMLGTEFPLKAFAVEVRDQDIWLNDACGDILNTFHWELHLNYDLERVAMGQYCVSVTRASIERKYQSQDCNSASF